MVCRCPAAGDSKTVASSSRSFASATTWPLSSRNVAGVAGADKQQAERPATWGAGDIALGIALSWILTVFLAPVIIGVTGADSDNLPIGTIALLQIPFD